MYTKRQSCVYSNTIIELFKEVVNIRLHCSTSQTSLLAIFLYSGFPKRKWKSKWNGINQILYQPLFYIQSVDICLQYYQILQIVQLGQLQVQIQAQMPNTRADITNVQVKRKTRDRLDKSGRRGETFDDIISSWTNVTVTIGIARDERRDNLSL